MATIIEAVATSHAAARPFSKGARKLADDAARRCLTQAGRAPQDVDLLVNAGIYREDELAEPALASMIQEDIEANLGYPPNPEQHGTFSFDISNGGSGVLTAFQLVDGFLRSKTISVGMIVTSDVPARRAISYPFGNTGAAAILRSAENHRGFVDFAFETFPEHEESFQSIIEWHPREHHIPMLVPGHNDVHVLETQDFARAALDCAVRVTTAFLDRQPLAPDDLDLVLTSQYPRGFPAAFADRLRISGNRVCTSSVEGAHTAAPLFALDHAVRTGLFSAARNVLFVTVSAGLTVGAALYRP